MQMLFENYLDIDFNHISHSSVFLSFCRSNIIFSRAFQMIIKLNICSTVNENNKRINDNINVCDQVHETCRQ